MKVVRSWRSCEETDHGHRHAIHDDHFACAVYAAGNFNRLRGPLHAAGKLGAIHFQFAPWITSGGDPRQLVEHCVRVIEGTPMAVEFRNASWWNERNRESTLAFEHERGLVNVAVDGPQGVGNSVAPVWEVTSPRLAVVRMHGRNHETWKGAAKFVGPSYERRRALEAARIACLAGTSA